MVSLNELSDILDDAFGDTPRYDTAVERSDDPAHPRGAYVGALERVNGEGEVLRVEDIPALKSRILAEVEAANSHGTSMLDDRSRMEQAAAWEAVWDFLEANNPEFYQTYEHGLDAVLGEIQRLIDGQCREAAPTPAGRIADSPFQSWYDDSPNYDDVNDAGAQLQFRF